jgi:hypothetical protein
LYTKQIYLVQNDSWLKCFLFFNKYTEGELF